MSKSRTNNRRRRIGQRRVAVAEVPTAFTPPVDPPSLQTVIKKVVTFDVQLTNATGTTITSAIDVDQIVKAITAITGISNPVFWVHRVMAWSSASISNPRLVLVDFETGLRVVDEGSYTSPAKAGINYPVAWRSSRTYKTDDKIIATVSMPDIIYDGEARNLPICRVTALVMGTITASLPPSFVLV